MHMHGKKKHRMVINTLLHTLSLNENGSMWAARAPPGEEVQTIRQSRDNDNRLTRKAGT